MSYTLLIGLLFLAASPVLMRLRYGRDWIGRPFALFVLAAVLYHGVSEAIISLTGVDERVAFRPAREWADLGVVAAGISLLIATVAYCVVQPRTLRPVNLNRDDLARVLDWRLLMIPLVPLVAATLTGSGYQSVTAAADGDALSSQGFAGQFLVPLLVLTTFAYVLRHPRHLIGALAAQSLVMALAGQRLEIAITAILLLLLTRRLGIKLSRRQIAVGGVVAMMMIVALTSSRSTMGRTSFQGDQTTGSARAEALLDGLLNPSYTGVVSDNPLEDAAVRVNTGSWTGGVLRAFDLDPTAKRIGPEPIYYTAVLMVPSAINPAKTTELTLFQRSPKAWQAADLNLPQTDFTTGGLMYYFGALGIWGQALFALLLGLIMGALDRWALQRQGAIGFLAVLTLMQANLFFEKGTLYTLTSFRAFLVLGLGLLAIAAVRGRSQDRGTAPVAVAAVTTPAPPRR